MPQITITINEKQWYSLERVAKLTKLSKQAIIEQLLNDELEIRGNYWLISYFMSKRNSQSQSLNL